MTKITPQFGNEDQIRLLQLEAKYDPNAKKMEFEDHDCGCEYCEFQEQVCPYCKSRSEYQFTDDKCDDCGKEVIDGKHEYELTKLREKLTPKT